MVVKSSKAICLLRPRRRWPRCHRAAEEREEISPSHHQPSNQGADYHILDYRVCCASQQELARRRALWVKSCRVNASLAA